MNKSNSNSVERKKSPENKNKNSINVLYKKRLNNSIDRLNISNIKRKNNNIKKNMTNKNYFNYITNLLPLFLFII